MPRLEYTTVDIKASESSLNDYGADGWEVVCIVPGTWGREFLMKRTIKGAPPKKKAKEKGG